MARVKSRESSDAAKDWVMAKLNSNDVSDPGRPHRTVRPIDLVHLAHQTLGDSALQAEILRLFEQQIGLYFERVRTTSDPHEIVLGLHTLKGASQGVGAFALAETARAAEIEFAETGQLDSEALDDLAMAVAEVSAYVCDLIDRTKAVGSRH